MARPSSRQKVLKTMTDSEIRASDPRAAQRAKDQGDIAVAIAKEEDRRASDPVSKLLDHGAFSRNESVTQAFGPGVIKEVNGDVSRLPQWRFTRRYLGHKVIIDLFMNELAYGNADVEARRQYVHAHGFRYAALGPFHSIQPHRDAKLRAKYPSQIEQLEQGGR